MLAVLGPFCDAAFVASSCRARLGESRDRVARARARSSALVARAIVAVAASRALRVPYKQCACGRTYQRASWGRLRFLGVLEVDDGEECEMRQCACGSTIAVLV